MSSINDQLAAYRRKKEKQQQNHTTTTTTTTTTNDESTPTPGEVVYYTPIKGPISWLKYHLKTILCVLLWLCLFMFFKLVEFGLVYVTVSALAFMLYSMDVRRRQKGELSAYSVFNENMERIDGTFTAEQFEERMIYGRKPAMS